MLRSVLLAAAAACALASCAGAQADAGGTSPNAALIADGRAIAVANCARCHALEEGQSRHVEAPPMRHILANYRSDVLAQDMIAGLHVSHQDMPEFTFNPQGADALIAYLRSIQSPDPGDAGSR